MAAASESQYSPPTSGLLSYFPASWVPYGELARIDRPAGIYLFYWPHLFGTLYAAAASKNVRFPDLLRTNALLFVGTVLFRAAACSWNDTMDREFDRKVRRCRLRPIARYAVTPDQAHVFTAMLTVAAAACLVRLPPPCWIVAAPSIFLLWLYPFAKRFTDFPQAVLGVQVAIGFPMGLAAVDCFSFFARPPLGKETSRWMALAAFYAANACWTIIYDTVYAQQDVEDDARAGVRSMAVHFRGRARTLLWTVAITQSALLLASGYAQEFGNTYMVMACGGTAASHVYMLAVIDLTKPSECAWWFKNGTWFVGLSIAGGLVLECMVGR